MPLAPRLSMLHAMVPTTGKTKTSLISFKLWSEHSNNTLPMICWQREFRERSLLWSGFDACTGLALFHRKQRPTPSPNYKLRSSPRLEVFLTSDAAKTALFWVRFGTSATFMERYVFYQSKVQLIPLWENYVVRNNLVPTKPLIPPRNRVVRALLLFDTWSEPPLLNTMFATEQWKTPILSLKTRKYQCRRVSRCSISWYSDYTE